MKLGGLDRVPAAYEPGEPSNQPVRSLEDSLAKPLG